LSDSEGKKKYHLVNRGAVSMCKEYGGLGIPNIRDLNFCLLGSWLRRYQQDGGKQWKEIIDYKYDTRNPNIFYSREVEASPFFKQLMWAAQAAKFCFRWKIGNGRKFKFWEDISTLVFQY